MSLLRKTLRLDQSIRDRALRGDLDFLPLFPGRDGPALRRLADACRGSGDHAPTPVGDFAGLLASRADRVVRAWLAWPRAQQAACPLGFITLIAAGRRFSIGWLLVHPQARRRGLGTALVDHVLNASAALGAEVVHAETLTTWPAAAGFWQRIAERLD